MTGLASIRLVSFGFAFKWIAIVILPLGILSLLLKPGISRQGRIRLVLVLPAGLLAYGLVFLYTRTYGQPYYLFMYVASVEILAIVFVVLFFLARKFRQDGKQGAAAPASTTHWPDERQDRR